MAEKVVDLTWFVLNPALADEGKHPEIKLRLSEADTLAFICKDRFVITGMQDHPNGTPASPFHRSTPFHSNRGSDNVHRSNSGEAQKRGAFKFSFESIDEQGNVTVIDPHFIVE